VELETDTLVVDGSVTVVLDSTVVTDEELEEGTMVVLIGKSAELCVLLEEPNVDDGLTVLSVGKSKELLEDEVGEVVIKVGESVLERSVNEREGRRDDK
jgi:hypothetical protein